MNAASAPSAQTSFFRQSGWMMITGVAAGAFMFGVHFFSKKIPESEYGILGTLLSILDCLTIPTLGLQMVFAQQTAGAITPEQRRQLSGTARSVLLGSLLLWLAVAVVVLAFQGPIATRLKFSNPAALWVTLLVALGALWKPIFSGLLQGHQNFLWLGSASILEGMGRFSFVAVIVLALHGYATGMMTGALIGIGLTILLLAWQSYPVLVGPGAPFAWRGWFAKVVPLTLGLGACQFMFSSDGIFVQYYFDGSVTFPYMAAGRLARALVFFTGPLAAVMFPKVVRSMARAEKTDVMRVALVTTAVLAGLGALVLTFIAPWLLPLVFKKSFLAAVPLLPAFACSMVPLTLANVLVYNLLARERFALVPWLVLLAVAYGITLVFFHGTFLTVIRILGLFNLLLLGLASWFTWRKA
jgi:O-antigen/teichoic acid export membrane protein